MFGADSKPVGSLFDNKNSIFGNQASIFAKPDAAQDDDKNSQDLYVNDDEPPTVVLEDKPTLNSPFEKVFEKDVQKFKQSAGAKEKKNCGAGRISIQKGTFGGEDGVPKSVIYKIIFKNPVVGKILYDCSISGSFSKHRKVEEKAYKNQLKIAVCQINTETKKQQVNYVLINFNRNDDMVEF